MSVYFKFNSELSYSHVDFDGLHISVSDLKKAILHQKRLGKSADFDLLISNAQTKEEYRDEQCLIPKNTSLIVARIPMNNQHKKPWETVQNVTERQAPNPSSENLNHDISRMNGTEEDKIHAMMMQSTLDYDPTTYQRVRGSNQTGEVPHNYRCHKCHKPGHWIKNCPLNQQPLGGKEHYHHKVRPESKKMTGIPRSLRENMGQENQEPQFVEEKLEIPEDLICAICKGIFRDAVMIPCCGNSFCDECVRTALLESDDNECPDCKEKGTSPGSLIPNRFLRNSVTSFLTKSSNVLVKNKKETQDPVAEETVEVAAKEEPEETQADESSAPQDEPVTSTEAEDTDQDSQRKEPVADKDSESDDDDNITVTVPSAHQQSRVASYRDARSRRIPSHNVDSFSHTSSGSKSHHEESRETYDEENNSESIERKHSSSSSRSNHNYDAPPQGISSLGNDDKGKSHYHSHSQSDYHQPDQGQQMYNQPMMPMHPHQMYPQGHYSHQQIQGPGPYYPPNRPMRFDHQGNYGPHPMRHHQGPMRPMHDGYGMRHRPPINHLANAVTQNIQQRYGTGIIDDPLEAFNRIMREKEEKSRKDRYRRSPLDRRSRSFERKRSPAHPYSPENRRVGKNYPRTRRRSRSFKSNSRDRSYSRDRTRSRSRMRGRSKSRSFSPRYRRREVSNKDRRDERGGGHHRSPMRRGPQRGGSKNPRGHYKEEGSYSIRSGGPRDALENMQHHEDLGPGPDKSDVNYESNAFDPPHSLDEQPPPPGDESDLANLEPMLNLEETDSAYKSGELTLSLEPPGVNGSGDAKKQESYHHHHKKSRSSKNNDNTDEKKSRDKKKRKKSKEHEKKKSKKEKREKKVSSKTGTPEPVEEETEAVADKAEEENEKEKPQDEVQEPHMEVELPPPSDLPAVSTSSVSFNRSDSILDINLDADEMLPEVSKWEREEMNRSFDASEGDSETIKKSTGEEKVTNEILKRAENAIFAKAISAIRKDPRPSESRKGRDVSPGSSHAKRSADPLQAFQVTVPANESGTRSVELKDKRRTPTRVPIKNRLGVKVSEKSSRSKSPKNFPSQLSSCIRVSSSDRRTNDRKRTRSPENRRKRTRTPEDRRKRVPDERFRRRTRTPERRRRSRTPEERKKRSKTPTRPPPKRSRSNSRAKNNPRHQRSTIEEKTSSRPKDLPKNDEKGSEDDKKARSSRKDEEPSDEKKRARNSSSSSSSASEHSKKHSKHKGKKKSRSPSAESNGNAKRKKSKKEKKKKSKKKSRK